MRIVLKENGNVTKLLQLKMDQAPGRPRPQEAMARPGMPQLLGQLEFSALHLTEKRYGILHPLVIPDGGGILIPLVCWNS